MITEQKKDTHRQDPDRCLAGPGAYYCKPQKPKEFNSETGIEIPPKPILAKDELYPSKRVPLGYSWASNETLIASVYDTYHALLSTIVFSEKGSTFDLRFKQLYIDIATTNISAVVNALRDIENKTGKLIGKRIEIINEVRKSTDEAVAYTTITGRPARLLFGRTPVPLCKLRFFLNSHFPEGMHESQDTEVIFNKLSKYETNIDINSCVPKELHKLAAYTIARNLICIPEETHIEKSELFGKPHAIADSVITLNMTELNENVSIMIAIQKKDDRQIVTYFILTDPETNMENDFRHGPGQSNQQRELFYVGTVDKGQKEKIILIEHYGELIYKSINSSLPTYIERPQYNSIIAWVNALTRLGLPQFFDKNFEGYNRFSTNKNGFDQRFNSKTVEAMEVELDRLISENRFLPDSWHEPEVIAQILVGLYYDYENAVVLFSKTGLFGKLLFPELTELADEEGDEISELILYPVLEPDRAIDEESSEITKAGPWKLAKRIRELMGDSYSKNGIALIVDEWTKRVKSRE